MLLWACGLTLLGTLLGFFKAVAAGLDGQYFAAMNESVDEGDDTGGVGGDVVPIGERSIGSDDDGTQLIASSDHLEEQVGVAVCRSRGSLFRRWLKCAARYSA